MGMTMYANGSTVLPTSGLYTYTEEPYLEYFHGTRSHNTVVVDGKDQVEGSAVAGSHGSSDGSTWASGVSGLYAGVTHHRTIVVLRQGLTLVVDDLASSAVHRYAQTWHMAPGSTVRTSGGDTYVNNSAGQATLAIHQADPAGLSSQNLFGATDPIQGWYSNSYGFKQPDWAVEDTRIGDGRAVHHAAGRRPLCLAERHCLRDAPRRERTGWTFASAGRVGYLVRIPTENSAAPTISSGACSG